MLINNVNYKMIKFIKSYIQATKYVYYLASFKDSKIPSLKFSDEHYIGLDQNKTIVRIFHSKKKENQSIIIFPGASPYAEKHPGMMMLGDSLRKIGYNVYLPRVPSLKNLILDKDNVNWFAHCYQELVKNKIGFRDDIMIIGLSYGGASLLKATLNKKMQNPKPKSILSYGTYFSIDTALDFFITGQIKFNNKNFNIKPHEWGPIVLFYNFIDTIKSELNTKQIKKILHHRIKDEHVVVEKKLNEMDDNSKEKKLISNILDGKVTKKMHLIINQMIQTNKDLLEFISPKNWIDQIDNKVFIMHGANDSMVPFTESTFLHQSLKNSTLLISFLYEHKEISTNRGIFFKIKEFLKLIKFNADYIKYNL